MEQTGNVQPGDQIVPGDLVEVTVPIWLSGRVAQDAGDPPDIPIGSQFRVMGQDEADELGVEEIELIPPDMYDKLASDRAVHMVATLIVPYTYIKKVQP